MCVTFVCTFFFPLLQFRRVHLATAYFAAALSAQRQCTKTVTSLALSEHAQWKTERGVMRCAFTVNVPTTPLKMQATSLLLCLQRRHTVNQQPLNSRFQSPPPPTLVQVDHQLFGIELLQAIEERACRFRLGEGLHKKVQPSKSSRPHVVVCAWVSSSLLSQHSLSCRC